MSDRTRRRRAATPLLAATLVAVAGCAGVGSGAAGSAPESAAPAAAPGSQELPPPGYGTLRQNDVSVDVRSGDLQLKVTPLAESVIRVTAPDTYRRLSALAREYRAAALSRSGLTAASLFLVTAYSESPDVPYVPEDLQLISKGTRLRAAAIVPVTGGWQQRRLRQRQPEMAVYAFGDEVDLESDLVVAYGLEESTEWNTILPTVRAERARARARAGG
jgi:hypothetical protein